MRQAFLWCLLVIPKETVYRVYPESHGYMSSLAIFREGRCVFALAPAKRWLLAYVRKPALNLGFIDKDIVISAFPNAELKANGEITMRLAGPIETRAFVDLLR